ncbi:HTH-type transcriptional regulator BetI [Aureimonas sp. SA4125]|uniref:transcriptional regulator BetI n=1 Tax=Aureimonas sp. SA4125 TaxID=2826993 RepID=UPI001CC5CDB2|nr:transcriptional regulator BetI [Aureimonas sp. SA4125]BDA86974.1 HTH-type transcriptional regulator BetI [Aureimonas sp. SA4125]
MSKGEIERQRRGALIRAAIGAIDGEGSLGVTMAEIARRAAVSPALAHHYFGAKDDLMLAAMRHLLGEYRGGVTERLRAAETPRARISAILEGSFDPRQFTGEAVAAWLVFYLHARRNAEAARLLAIYFRRLESNLVAALTPLVGRTAARPIAQAAGSLIDGVWLRHALAPHGGDAAVHAPTRQAAAAVVERFIDSEISAAIGIDSPTK